MHTSSIRGGSVAFAVLLSGCSVEGLVGGDGTDSASPPPVRAETPVAPRLPFAGDGGSDGPGGAGGGSGGAPEAPFFDPGQGMGVSAYHACIVVPDGGVECFGKHQARTIPPEGLKAVELAAGHVHNCARTAPGAPAPVVCFGFGEEALLPPEDMEPTQLSVGQGTSCAVGEDGAVACWFNEELAVQPPRGLVAKYVATSAAFTCAIDLDDRVRCWGLNPPELPEEDLRARHIAVAQSEATQDPPETRMRHACAVRLDRSVVCWGDDTEGEVSAVPEGLLATQVSIGNTEACAVSTSGDLVCWGKPPKNLEGLERPDDLRARAVRIVHNNGCALLEDEDRLRCWGFNDPERYAEGTPDDAPVFVPEP